MCAISLIVHLLNLNQALASAVLIESKDNYLHFYLTAVKRYDSNSVPFVYLANILEVRDR
jgi:hypothetical protein